ncbi:MAG TPA: hypothetical protein VFI90_08485, partial [Rubrobacter sp.]|nr:hypothetical protein [Rubrobacter sp.]
EQLDDERAARRANEGELRNKLRELGDRLHSQRARYAARVEHLEARVEHFKTRGEALEARVENLSTQLQDLKSRNENLSDDLSDIEESTIWRLFGPYRRLRARMDATGESTSEDAKGNSAARSG